VKRAVLIASLAGLVGAGCDLLLDAGSYHLLEPAGDAGAGDEDGGGDAGPVQCQNANGFGGLGCWACAPVTREQYLNQCSAAACTPFDRAGLSRLLADGGLPTLPAPSVDAGTRPDAGADPGGSLDAGELDAGPDPDAGADAGTVPDAGGTDAGAADAGALCLGLTNPLVIVGSSAMKPFLARLAPKLGNDTAPITIVYQSSGSCVGVQAILQATAAKGTATWWDPTAPDVSNERTCALPPTGTAVDIGMSDVFATSCGGLPFGLPANVGDFTGPIQTMAIVVPGASRSRTISAEAAYLAWGFGAASGTSWTDETVLFQRGGTSGTQSLIASVIQVPPAQWRGLLTKNSDDMLAKLLAVPLDRADEAIGILSTDYADNYRGDLRVLAFQDFGQRCAVTPDTTATSFDKANVRSGQYPLWGPVHFLVRVNAGAIVSANADRVIGYLNGTRDLSGVDLVQYYSLRRLVPSCAMRVTREGDGAAPEPYKAPRPCGCYFESQATGQTSCQGCTRDLDCPASAPKCSFGYCEKL
jgi:ABC-type phosphate transport system substrate-binding protein